MTVTIFPEVGFYYRIPDPQNFDHAARLNIKVIINATIKLIDEDKVLRNGINLPPFQNPDEHVKDDKVEAVLGKEVKKLDPDPNRYSLVTPIAELCYVIRAGQIFCYHCYGLLDAKDGKAEEVIVPGPTNPIRIPIQVVLAYPSPFV